MEDVVRPLTLQENPVKVSEVLPVTRLAAEAYLEQFHSVDDLHKAAQDLPPGGHPGPALELEDVQLVKRQPPSGGRTSRT